MAEVSAQRKLAVVPPTFAFAVASGEALQGTFYVLSRDIVAFECGGLLTKLPIGARVEVVGRGLIDSLVKIRSAGALYYAFLRDLKGDEE